MINLIQFNLPESVRKKPLSSRLNRIEYVYVDLDPFDLNLLYVRKDYDQRLLYSVLDHTLFETKR